MNKIDELTVAAGRLTDDQIAELLELARAMSGSSYYASAPQEALDSLERGLAQLDRGETVTLDEVDRRLRAAAERPDR